MSEKDAMVHRLSAEDIRGLGFDWPKYVLIQENCVIEAGKVDLAKTRESLRSSRAFYQKQLRDAHAFKMQTGAGYSDFTDRFDDYARMERDLGTVISYLEGVITAASRLVD
jgi:hypothetical protein